MPDICLARFDDLPAILAISNWAAKHTTANFAVEPETLESWRQDWRDTHEMYPWFVAVDKPSPRLGESPAETPAPLPGGEGGGHCWFCQGGAVEGSLRLSLDR